MPPEVPYQFQFSDKGSMADDSIPMILQGEAAAVDVGCTQNTILKVGKHRITNLGYDCFKFLIEIFFNECSAFLGIKSPKVTCAKKALLSIYSMNIFGTAY